MKIRKAVFLFLVIFLILTTPAHAGGTSSANDREISVETPESSKSSLELENKSLSEGLNSIRSELSRISVKDQIPWEAIVALLLGLAGIFKLQDFIDKKWLHRPRWNVDIKLSSPDSHKIALRNPSSGQVICDTYYFRFRVANDGNYQMEDIEVLVEELYKKSGTNNYTKVKNFLPLNLVWAHNHLLTMPKIQPKLFKHCDFAHIVETRYLNLSQFGITSNATVAMLLDTYVQPNTGSHIILPGKYKIKIVFAANNLSPEVAWFKLEFRDAWDNNEQRMLSHNVVIERVYS